MSGQATRERIERMTLAITGFATGGGGSLLAERTISRLPGVIRAYVSPSTEMAYLEYDSKRLDLPQLTEAVERIGLHIAELQRR